MRNRLLATLAGWSAALAVAGPAVAQQQQQQANPAQAGRPNIILIVSDDQGYADLGVHGCKDIPTPHIDALASSGVRFTNGYVSGPYCSPTRAGLLTGRYQQRFGHEFNPGADNKAAAAAAAEAGEPGGKAGLPTSEVTLADRLKAAGYRTGLVGKWHLGYEPEFHPQARGFDEFYGFLGGAHSYLRFGGAQPILRGTKPVAEPDGYTTDAFAREAVGFIDRHLPGGSAGDRPFFLYLAFNAVHGPMEATPKYLERFKQIEDPKRRTYAAMTSALDDAVGQVTAKLRDAKFDQNTLVFYVADNGGPTAVNASSNAPLRGAKAQTLEGGVRVPFFAAWPAKLPAGRTYDQPVIQLDMFATALAAAGVSLPADSKPIDGVDLAPYVTGQKQGTPHDALYWRFGAQWAVRAGDWKLVRHREGPAVELYNLKDDVGESKNLADAQPEKAKELKALYEKWNAQLVPPAWGQPDRFGKPADPDKAKKKQDRGKRQLEQQKQGAGEGKSQ